METKSQALIKQIKEIKQQKKITYNDILDALTENGIPALSLTTLRRVFANNSESRASSFNYEETLLPIAEALLDVEDVPTDDNSPYAKEIDGLKAVIHVQNEELAKMHELKEHLEARITFLLEQIEKKDRRMDEKDEIIKRMELYNTNLPKNAPLDLVFNVAYGGNTTLLDLFKCLRENLSRFDPEIAKVNPAFRENRPGDIPHSQASILKAQLVLGYQPKYDAKTGFAEACEWYWNNLR